MLEPGYPRRKLSGQLVWAALWLAVTVLGAFVLRPSAAGHGTHTQIGLPSCPTVMMFARPCPGCGMTTSWTRLLHGDLAGAQRAHPFGPFLYLAFSASAGLGLFGYLRGYRFDPSVPWLNRIVCVFAVVFVAYGVWRFSTQTYLPILPRLASGSGSAEDR